jgi:hypothetical protein
VKEGEKCGDIGEFDPCEYGFFCNDTGVAKTDLCERSPLVNPGYLNDGCKTDRWCSTGFTCQSGLCKKDPAIALACTSDIHCTFDKYCDLTTPTDPKCIDKPGDGSACLAGGQCKSFSYCTTTNTSGVCKAFFSSEEGADCKGITECKAGLLCDCIKPPCQAKCIKPTYFILAGPGAAWGEECNPADTAYAQGCQCNFATKTYMYLKERSTTYPEALVPAYKNFIKCLVDNGCGSIFTTGPMSCLRTRCYSIYREAFSLTVPDRSLLPPVCSAQGLAAMFALIVMMLLL